MRNRPKKLTPRAVRNATRRLDPTAKKGGPTPRRVKKEEPLFGPAEIPQSVSRRRRLELRKAKEHWARRRALRLVRTRQAAAAEDLALAQWQRQHPGATPGEKRHKGKFIKAAPPAGIWP